MFFVTVCPIAQRLANVHRVIHLCVLAAQLRCPGTHSAHPAARIRLTEIPLIWGNIARNEVFRFATIADLPDEAQRDSA